MTATKELARSDAVYLDASTFPKVGIEEDPGSHLVRILVTGSRLPLSCSFVSFGEFFKIVGTKAKQAEIGVDGYLFECRSFLKDLDIGKIRRVEPPEDRFQFLMLARDLLSRHAHLGGGDVWHLMSALQLKASGSAPSLLTFDRGLAAAAVQEGLIGVYGYDVDPDAFIAELTTRGLWTPALP